MSDHSDSQQYGVLATQLNDALGLARAALAPHAPLLDPTALERLDRVLAEFDRRRVRIALYGEIKAGKSTLLNALAGAVLSPSAFEPLTSTPVRVTYGKTQGWRWDDERLAGPDQLETLMRTRGAAPGEIVVETDLDLLQLGGQVDLLDTPGVGSAADYDAVTAEALKSLDAVILVVRYPALFTQFTRHLKEELERDIGKLFVVWNLDAACYELTYDDRMRHTENLRASLLGARDLHQVDARAGLQAAMSGDVEAVRRSGITDFAEALRRYAGSAARHLGAVREAAKRARQWLDEAATTLSQRKEVLEAELSSARQRIEAVRRDAQSASSGAQTRFSGFDSALGNAASQYRSRAEELSTNLKRQLTAARRRWVRNGDYAALESAAAAAIDAFGADASAASASTARAIDAEASRFGATCSTSPRPRTLLAIDSAAPDDRRARATTGRLLWLRRALFPNWYLPGLAELERDGISAEMAAENLWIDNAVQAARQAAEAVLRQRLDEIRERAAGETTAIEAETNLAANEAEHAAVATDLPVIEAQVEVVARVASEARSLLGDAASPSS